MTTSPGVNVILDQVFTLLRIPFVTDFIFTPDPVADITILTAPVQTSNSIAARITVSGTETTTQFAHIFDFAADFYFVSVPAFCINGITVGFCIQEPTQLIQDDHLPAGTDRVHCNRYVRDDAKGIFLMLSENLVTGITEVDCMSHQSTRKRTRICARFNTMALRNCIRSPNGNLHPEHVVKCLSYLSVASENRKCPICATPGEQQCNCILPFKKPSHPLDFSNERRNMSLHTGRYHGASTIRLFNTLQPLVITNLETRSIIKGSVDKDIILRMNKFAVQICMSKLAANPLGMLISAGVASLPLWKHDVDGLLEGMNPGEMSLDMFPGHSSVSGSAESEEPSYGSPPLSIMGDGSRDYLKEFVDTNTNGKKSVYGAAPKESQKSSDCESGERSIGDKELRAEIRRQRNREAAAKSNIKRKIRNEALRKHLAEANKRVNELRAVEKRLREENVKLRSMANKKKVKISSHLTHIQIANS